MSQGICPVCHSANFMQTKNLKYFKCADCGGVFRLVHVKTVEDVSDVIVVQGKNKKDYIIHVEHCGKKEIVKK